MIPDSAAALLALLGLVAPGLVFELQRERRRPQDRETTFREISRVALTSLIFTTVTLAILLPLAAVWSALPDVAAWMRDPKAYVPAHYAAVGWFLLLELVLAIGLALVAERLTAGGLRGTIAPGSVWYNVFRRDVPERAGRVWLWVTTESGTQFKGPLRAYTPSVGDEGTDLVLGGKQLLRRGDTAGWERLDGFDAVVIPAAEVRHVVVSYLDANGTTLHAEPPPTVRQRLRRSFPGSAARPGRGRS